MFVLTAEVQWSCSACVLELDNLVRAHLFDRTLLADEMISQTESFMASIPKDDKRRTTAEYYLKLMEKIRSQGVSFDERIDLSGVGVTLCSRRVM